MKIDTKGVVIKKKKKTAHLFIPISMEGLAFSGETEAVNNIPSEVRHCLVPSTAYISD